MDLIKNFIDNTMINQQSGGYFESRWAFFFESEKNTLCVDLCVVTMLRATNMELLSWIKISPKQIFNN